MTSIVTRTATVLSLSLSVLQPALGVWSPYQIKPGDQLGNLLLSKNLNLPLWGNEGSVQKVFEYNKEVLSSADLLVVGNEIYLPGSKEDFSNTSVSQEMASTVNEAESEAKEEVQEVSVKQAASEKSSESESSQSENNEEEVYTPAHLKIGATFSLLNLDIKNDQESLNLESDLAYGASARGEFPLEEDLFLDLGIGYKKLSFSQPDGLTLDAGDDTFFNFNMGMVSYWNRFSLGFGFHYGQDPVVTALSATTIQVKSFQIFSPYLKARYAFYSKGRTQLSLEAMGMYNLPSKTDRFELDSGYNAILNFDIERKLSAASSLSFVPFVDYQKKESGPLEQKGTEIGVKVFYNLLD
ncbi:MAG: hypothetical protein CME60_05280 [Halobacteriovoraceae bacterium]|nr:hypothetical protein [Halobacteriovoraceae bacterium]